LRDRLTGDPRIAGTAPTFRGVAESLALARSSKGPKAKQDRKGKEITEGMKPRRKTGSPRAIFLKELWHWITVIPMFLLFWIYQATRREETMWWDR
jgi:hypothetical protein